VKAFIIFRDRVSYAAQCYSALALAGLDVHVVDHNSTWPAAVSWLAALEDAGGPVLRRGENAYPWELWEWRPFQELISTDPGRYVVTDPDVWPSGDCPDDWLDHLSDIADRHPGAVKVGLGLRMDRLPQDSAAAGTVTWEQAFWRREAEPGVFHANVDTTLALYKPWAEYPVFAFGPALRTGYPYVADHYGYYERPPLGPELDYYHAHADNGHTAVRTVRGKAGILHVKHAPMGSRDA
jgi:hypothetical protein